MISIGIDGGGSTLRVGIFTENMECLHLHELAETANPSVLGFSQAEELLRSSLTQTISDAGITSSTVQYVGAGMAGAAQNPDWLRNVLTSVLSHAQITVAPDYEIALIGAHDMENATVCWCFPEQGVWPLELMHPENRHIQEVGAIFWMTVAAATGLVWKRLNRQPGLRMAVKRKLGFMNKPSLI